MPRKLIETHVLCTETLEPRMMLSSVQVIAAGSENTETLDLQIDGQTVQSWSNIGGDADAGQFETFQWTSPENITADQVRIRFSNDNYQPEIGVDANLRVDAILIDGVRFESENSNVFSTGTWSPEDGVSPGNRESEFLHANGYLQFAETDSANVFESLPTEDSTVMVTDDDPSEPAVISLSNLDGTNGFRIEGIDEFDKSGYSVSSAGDVNGDGFDDVIIGAPDADRGVESNAGESYVVFGKATGFEDVIELSELDGTNGFRIDGRDSPDKSGTSVSGAGDVNGDGVDDIIIGAVLASNGVDLFRSGESYVVYGRTDGFSASIDLGSLGDGGIILAGANAFDGLGRAVSGAGDFNGDGIDDFMVGAPAADPSGSVSGEAYVVFGSDTGFPVSVITGTANGATGYLISGLDFDNALGQAMSAAGDVNGDGIDDIIVAAPFADVGELTNAGQSYVIFGSSTGFSGGGLSGLDGTNGFRIDGLSEGELSGTSVSGAGDINGDGLDDIIIGAPRADADGKADAGRSYVVFGSSDGFGASFDLTTLDGTNGFILNGIDGNDRVGSSVAGIGDFNADGFDDVLVSSPLADQPGNNSAGESYVVFGKGSGFDATVDLDALNGTDGFRVDGIDGNDESGFSVSGAGDVNGDGADDLIIGARHADPRGTALAGESYVVFGTTVDVTRFSDATATIREGGFDSLESALATADANDLIRINDPFDESDVGEQSIEIENLTVEGDAPFDGSFTLREGVENFSLRGSTKADATGNSLNNRIYGSDGANTIQGGAGNDYVRGGAGADTLDGGAGIDWLQYIGSSEGVTIDLNMDAATGLQSASGGDAEGDVISSFERVYATEHADTINGNEGKNYLIGRAGDDIIDAGSGNDSVRGGKGADTLDGGDGIDWLQYISSAEGVTVDLNSDAVTGLQSASGGDAEGDVISGFERINATEHADTLSGNDESNFFIGRGGDDVINAGAGNDIVRGGVGADTLDGGEGIDWVQYIGSAEGVAVDLNSDAVTGLQSASGGDADGDVISGFEWINATEHADTLSGNDESNFFIGRGGDDVINAGAGNDIVRGGKGADTLDGGEGIDWLQYTGSPQGVAVDLNSDEVTGLQSASGGDADGDVISGFERIKSTEHADTLNGDEGNNYFIGRGGDDVINAGAGNDAVRGGKGADMLDGGEGIDWLQYIGSAQGVTVDLSVDAVTGLQSASGGDAQGDVIRGFERVNATEHADTLNGNEENNYIIGRGGDDVINAGAGDDFINAGAGSDRLIFDVDDGSDTVLFYEQGIDLIEFVGLQFADLTVTSTSNGAIVEYGVANKIHIRSFDNASLAFDKDDFLFT